MRTFLQRNGKFKWNSITSFVRDSEFNLRFLYLIFWKRSRRERECVQYSMNNDTVYYIYINEQQKYSKFIAARVCLLIWLKSLQFCYCYRFESCVLRSSQTIIMLCFHYVLFILGVISQMKAFSSQQPLWQNQHVHRRR